MDYTKDITPSYETIGKRRRLTGYIGEIRDGAIVLHSQEYSTYHQAEVALDAIVYDLLTDLCERGLVDALPEPTPQEVAAHMTSVSIPNWQPAVITADDLPY